MSDREMNSLKHLSKNNETKDQMIAFCKSHRCDKVNLIAGQRFPEEVYNHFCGDLPANGPLFSVNWVKGTSIPSCLQEAVVGYLSNHVVYSLGYCAGLHDHSSSKMRKGLRGFSQKSYGFNMITNKWTKIPKFPGQGRQGARGVVLNDVLYVWGGWTYQPLTADQINNIPQSQWPAKKGCQTFSDGYKLQLVPDVGWTWTKLAALPFPRTNYGICSWEGVIYVWGGGHVIDGQMTCSDEFNYLYKYDPKVTDSKWERLAKMPGTKRINCSMSCVNGVIFILGGMSPHNSWKYSTENASRCYGVLDQWKYIIAEDKWVSIIDNVTYNGNWGGYDQIVYKGKYIIVAGGSYFPEIKRNDEIVEQGIKPCMHDISHCACGNTFLDRIYAFDTVTEKFIKCSTNLPGLINLPMIRVLDDGRIAILGGETYGFNWQGEMFPRPHIDIFAFGDILGI